MRAQLDSWVEEAPGLIRLIGTAAGGASLRVLMMSWAIRGKATQVGSSDFIWRLAEPSPGELRALKSFAVLSDWRQTRHVNAESPQFARLLQDARAQVEQIFARLLLLDGHLSQNARPVLVDCEPPLSLRALLLRQAEAASAGAIG